MVIRKTDRIADVLERHPSLIDIFASASPVFERLRRPAMRRVMARLVSVEQAARIAGVDAERLVARLNAAVGESGAPRGEEARGESDAGGDGRGVAGLATPDVPAVPAGEGWLRAALSRIPEEAIVEIDVREELRAGREPFKRIMVARRRVPPGGCLVVRAIFEPVPLYAVLAAYGFAHHTEKLADDDWRVTFYPDAWGRDGAAPAGITGPIPPAGPPSGGEIERRDPSEANDRPGTVIELDVRGLEPPEPMIRTLEALESLPPGGTLVHINVRVPRFLLPELERRGFTHEIQEVSPELIRVHIRRAVAAPD